MNRTPFPTRRADLSVAEAAEQLNCDTRRVYQLIGQGHLQSYRLAPRITRVRWESVEALRAGERSVA
ncbi:excisionase family DNA-binding protein [Lutimaribacter marinistellae]|uniref:Excisionase family DNA-binding protein n=1 Tax=Lutimaribacter marinistellae TaxID=1820329 RepID=A0ABV7TLN3_9RHOB